MTNPYATPGSNTPNSPNPAKSLVAGPAISLIVVSSICLALVSLGLVFDVIILATGFAAELPPPQAMSKNTQLVIRILWGIALLGSNTVVLIAAIKMLKLKSYGFVKLGLILSVVPVLGPCCILGIPFGIWGLIVIGKPEVASAFR